MKKYFNRGSATTLRRCIVLGFAVFVAITMQARVEYAWSAPFALAETVTNAPAVQTGDQHTLFFTNGMVRVHHRVTDEWFDLQSAPFAMVSAAKRLDDDRLLVTEAGGARAAYGTPAAVTAAADTADRSLPITLFMFFPSDKIIPHYVLLSYA